MTISKRTYIQKNTESYRTNRKLYKMDVTQPVTLLSYFKSNILLQSN